jgi:hypothetical protein
MTFKQNEVTYASAYSNYSLTVHFGLCLFPASTVFRQFQLLILIIRAFEYVKTKTSQWFLYQEMDILWVQAYSGKRR